LCNRPDFGETLDALEKHCSGRVSSRKSWYNAVRAAAVKIVKRIIDREMMALKPVMNMDSTDVTIEALIAIDKPTMMDEMRTRSPTTWDIYKHAPYTVRQVKYTTREVPDPVSFLVLLCVFACPYRYRLHLFRSAPR
jgi:hypothetical protein